MQLKVCDTENISPNCVYILRVPNLKIRSKLPRKRAAHSTLELYARIGLFFLGPNGFKWLKRTGWLVVNRPFKRPHRRPKTRLIEAKVHGNYILNDGLDFHTTILPCCAIMYSFFLSSLHFYSFLSLFVSLSSFLLSFFFSLSFFLSSY